MSKARRDGAVAGIRASLKGLSPDEITEVFEALTAMFVRLESEVLGEETACRTKMVHLGSSRLDASDEGEGVAGADSSPRGDIRH